MAICEWCKKKFDPELAQEMFADEYMLRNYDNFKVTLCGKCAIEAIEEKADGVYFETCDKCGKTFDYFADAGEFFLHADGASLDDFQYPSISCCDCALEEWHSLPY